MKFSVVLIMLSINWLVHADKLPLSTDLESLQWKNRIVIVNEDVNHSEDDKDAETEFNRHRAQINDRDILWFIHGDELLRSNYSGELSSDMIGSIRETVSPGPGSVVLIGKDGGIKSRYDRLDLEAIFAEIDMMPMRQQEMQEKQEWRKTR